MQQPLTNPQAETAPAALSLLELNSRVKQLLNNPQVQNVWIQAETSDVKQSTHCYLELIQKNEKGSTIAKLRAVIWNYKFLALNNKFRNVTGMDFSNGMNVMLNVTISYHEVFGISATINDIDPNYTLGDMVRIRREIIARLTSENLINRNKQIPMPPVPQRIAVISSDGAAGYGDFMKQLNGNAYSLKFYTCLFKATMQGVNTAQSIINALNSIENLGDNFDCVVIIRGGGSTSDLNSFDNYEAAARIAVCSLPVIVGIGHERDETVLDYVANTRVKTPTAAAEFLIQCGVNALARLGEVSNIVVNTTRSAISAANEHLSYISGNLPVVAEGLIAKSRQNLMHFAQTIPLCVSNRIAFEQNSMSHHTQNIVTAASNLLQNAWTCHHNTDDKIKILSPRNIINRGFAVVVSQVDGKIISNGAQIGPSGNFTVHMRDGKLRARQTEFLPDNKK